MRIALALLTVTALLACPACSGGVSSTDPDASTRDGSSNGSSSGTSGGTSGSSGTTPSGPTDVKDTFNHACTTDDDCAVVFIGGTCGICSSANSAIAKSDLAAYQKAYNDARANCPSGGAVGDCAASYGVSQCSAAKTCTYIRCGDSTPPKDEHHCAPDGG